MTVSRRPARWRLALIALALLAPLSARAQGDEHKPESREHQLAHFASHDGNILFLVAGVALPLMRDGGQGKDHALRVVDSLATTALLTEGLKALTKEKRPDSDEHNSFPSGHASAAFAVATMESAFHPREAPLWFLGAATIGWSRIRLNRHYTHDVVAGALLGFGVARWEVPKTNGLILTPYINPKDRSVRLELGRGF